MNANVERDSWWGLPEDAPECVLICGGNATPGLFFHDPIRTIGTDDPRRVQECLLELDEVRRDGEWTAGYVCYEALDHLHEVASTRSAGDLLWFGVFRSPIVLNECGPDGLPFPISPYRLERQDEPQADRDAFLGGVGRVRSHLERGDCYQINLTTQTSFRFEGSDLALFRLLWELQPAGQAAFVKNSRRSILSLSPELFFRLDSQGIETRPVKGTLPRCADQEADRKQRDILRESPKNRAENLMITDLLRNDLGACSEFGSVRVGPLFAVESLPTLHQMYSTIRARPRSECREYLFSRLLPTLFPCGSVTGAPKLAARRLIREIETQTRGPYTGSIGFAAPLEGAAGVPEAWFNVAIRTVTIEGERARFGSGCGIVWDSQAEAEYAEAELKRAFLLAACSDFALIETMRVRSGRVVLLLAHMRRLRRALREFSFPVARWREALDLLRTQVGVTPDVPVQDARLRLLVPRFGALSLSCAQAASWPTPGVALVLSPERIHSGDPFRRHKTTMRATYDRERERWQAQGYDDALFANENGELVEASLANVLLLLGGDWVTPTVEAGALPGVALASLENRRSDRPGKRAIVRRKIELREIERAQCVLVCNSVRGLGRVRSITEPGGGLLYLDRTTDSSRSPRA